ncbi:MAG: hypothetical protein PWP76_760, partial [Candidatus Diapherotrites archaeon]|nr:hypothetical protein [Candidatus Diapherotrites archaeon]
GGYFAFTSLGGGSETVTAPYVEASAKVVQGEKGYTVVLDGSLKLPGAKKYEIQALTASLLINGVPVQSKNLVEDSTKMEGPTSFPLSFSPDFAPSAENVAVKIEGNVVSGKDIYVISSQIPVALPDKSSLAREPSLSVSTSSVTLLGSTKSVTLSISIYNPNDSSMDFDGLTLNYGSSSYDLPVDSVPAKGVSTVSQVISLPADVTAISVSVSGSYSVNGVSRSLNRDFDLNVPKLSEQPLQFEVKSEVVSLDRDGYELNVFGSVKNPNAFNITLDTLKFRVIKDFGEGNIVQETVLLEGVDLLPQGSKAFSKSVKINAALSDAVGEVSASYSGKDVVIAIFPIPLIDPSDFIDPLSVKLQFTADVNNCTITPVLTGPSDYNVDVDFKISDGTNTKDYGSFTLSGTKTLDAFTVSPGLVAVTADGSYGIESMGVMFPLKYVAEFNCST